MNTNYTQFKQKSDILYTLASDTWVEHYGWDVFEVPEQLWRNEQLLSEVDSEFKINRVAVLRTDPFQNYVWHRDDYRGVAINMLLSHEKSHCLFGTNKNDDNMYFEELEYLPNTFYLFNTQKLHTVINFQGYRYMLSVEFVDTKSELNYFDVYWWAKHNNLVEAWPSG